MDPSDDLAWMPAWQVRDLVAAREVSPVAVVQASLRRIETLNPKLNAFVNVCADEALDQARAAEASVLRGDALGPLHGVPVAIKDEAWVAGVRTRAGSLLFEDFIPDADAVPVRRLREAGAVIVGMTNVPEFMGWSRTANRLIPETVNPWDLRRSPGASSGGSGAALASGMVPIAIGSDGGGSIRIPSAANGVVGLFPTPGRVPDTNSFSYAYIGSLGPMARNVRDVATMIDVMAGPDGVDQRFAGPASDCLGGLDRGVAGLRFAWTPDFGYIATDPRVAERVRAAALGLALAGAAVEEPGLVFDDVWEWFGAQIQGHAAFSGQPPPFLAAPAFKALCRQPESYERLCEYSQRRKVDAAPLTAEAFATTQARTRALKRQFDTLFETYDAILSPTLPVTAPLLPEGLADPYPTFCCGTYFTAVANLAELPAASFPCGFVDGLPVGLQVIGRRGREDTVLQVCRALEQLTAPEDRARRPAWLA